MAEKSGWNSFWAAVWSVFCEDDGHGSWSRIGGCVSLLAVLAWVTHVVLHTHAIPENIDLTATFLTATNGPYLVNKLHSGATAIWGAKDIPPTPAA